MRSYFMRFAQILFKSPQTPNLYHDQFYKMYTILTSIKVHIQTRLFIKEEIDYAKSNSIVEQVCSSIIKNIRKIKISSIIVTF